MIARDTGGSHRKQGRYHHYSQSSSKPSQDTGHSSGPPVGKMLGFHRHERSLEVLSTHPDRPRLSLLINDSYCITHLFCKTSQDKKDSCTLCKTFNLCTECCKCIICLKVKCIYYVVNYFCFAYGLPQKERLKTLIDPIL